MECKTQKGLYFIIIGSIIALVANIITSSIYLLIKSDAVQIITTVIGLVSFIGAIILLIGLVTFYIGRKEFGENHENNVRKALIIIVINIIVAVVLASAIAFMTFSAIVSSSESTLPSGFSFSIIIFAVISAVLGGLTYYFGLIELEDETGKNVLFAAIVSSILISVITSIYLAGWLGDFLGDISSASSYSTISLNQNIGGIGILGVIPSLLFLYAYYIPYKRIKEGELKPKINTMSNPNLANRICPTCGRPIPMDARVCPYCGKIFEDYIS
jgi:MFS family permease